VNIIVAILAGPLLALAVRWYLRSYERAIVRRVNEENARVLRETPGEVERAYQRILARRADN
jgi:hypothetical protein